MLERIPRNAAEREEEIRNIAYFLAQKRGFASGKEKDDWYEAEKIVDARMLNPGISSNELYRSLMSKFFSSIDIESLTSSDLAARFVGFVESNRKYLEPTIKREAITGADDFRNISLLAQDTALDFLTRRTILLANSTLLSHKSAATTEYAVSMSSNPDPDGVFDDSYYYTNCPSLTELGVWLKSCRGLLETGEIFYYPKTKVIVRTSDYHVNDNNYDTVYDDDHLYDAIVSSRKIVEPISHSLWRTNLVQAVVRLEIPVIDNVDLSHFTKISCDEHYHLEKFRNHIREQFIDICANEGSESFGHELQRIGIRLERGIVNLTSDVKSLNQKTALRKIGATIGTVMAILVAVNGTVFDSWSTALGAGGGLAAFLKIIEDYQEKHHSIESSPYYYLWLLDKS